jgi:hypothetical protein
VPGRDDATCFQVEAAVAAVVRWVAEEYARGGPRTEFVAGRGAEVGIAQASEHTEVVVARWRAEK